eukprot:29630-Pelagococcus_subviridis.AAC.6
MERACVSSVAPRGGSMTSTRASLRRGLPASVFARCSTPASAVVNPLFAHIGTLARSFNTTSASDASNAFQYALSNASGAFLCCHWNTARNVVVVGLVPFFFFLFFFSFAVLPNSSSARGGLGLKTSSSTTSGATRIDSRDTPATRYAAACHSLGTQTSLAVAAHASCVALKMVFSVIDRNTATVPASRASRTLVAFHGHSQSSPRCQRTTTSAASRPS